MASPSSIPPTKKQRGGSTPVSRNLPRGGRKTDVGIEADDAIARRRAELRRLAEQRNKKAASSSTARGRPAASASSNSRPPITSAADLMKPSANLTKTTRSRSAGRAPPPPPVARKLEFNNSSGKAVAVAPTMPAPGNISRAKSVPPRRPAAPPARAGSTKRGGGGAAAAADNRSQQLPPRRPAPVDPTTLLAKNTTTATTTTAAVTESSLSSKPTQQSLPPTTTTDSEPPLMVEEEEITSSSSKPFAAKTPATSAKMMPMEATPSMPTTTTTTEPSSTTSRRDRMKQLRDGLESPKTTASNKPTATTVEPSTTTTAATVNPLGSASNDRLEEELKKTEVERNEAFQKIKELEDKLTDISKSTILQQKQQKQQTPVQDMASLQEIMELYKKEGEEAAMQYAQSKLASTKQQAGFLTPMPSTPLSKSLSTVSQRVATPYPNRGIAAKGKAQPTDEDLERRFIHSFREAVNFVPHEFYGKVAIQGQSCVFFVRRPYGLREQNGIFELVSPTVLDAYAKRAHVGDPTTIEVAVGIPFDDSVLCLSGSMGVRYRITPTGAFESKPFVKEPLGSISFIDESANEQEYSLDQILQEALSVREQYCASMMTTALGFERRKPLPAAATEDGASVAASAAPKPEVADVAVDTSDMPIPKEIALDKTNKKEEKKPKESKPKPSDPEELPGAGDVLISFMGIVIKNIFGFIWWIFIGLPITTIRASIAITFAGVIVGMLYLYALQYHHEALLGGGNSFYYSSSASYHTNIAPGIL
ncbi:unnamed protein product [Cylindrotheca closterium]|uniref:Uncharacterized protein n=1 Tax=Cylindrotheca closterium TaxID=2856 RepID=A0AAD2CGU4_9STRA|nr:unnamed protein product [Cylindrotheca closterium]